MIVERVSVVDAAGRRDWPFDVPAVEQLVRDGLAFTRPVTFLVGENGSGKSTLVEALAEAYGVDVRGGHAGRRYASPLPKGELGERMRLDRGVAGRGMRGRAARGFFLRAETALGMFEFMSDLGVAGYGDRPLTEVSHGESFLRVFEGRFTEPGLYLMDEPEAALSFTSCLRLVGVLHRLAEDGAQVICATHSPLLAATPGAAILELGDHGVRAADWAELDLVDHWRRYLADPHSYLRHIVAG